MKNYLKQSGRWGFRSFVSALALSFFLPVATTLHAEDNGDEEEVREARSVVVTGSRIRRIDAETPQPVLRLSREDLENTGFSTVGDAMRALPFTTGTSLFPIDAGTSFTPGISTFNLRGLGNNNVLVLINGRRASPFGSSGFNGFQTLFDFNSLPTGAIESIEILKDGGSAIYGSDAVSGVVNVTLRRDYEGLNVTVGAGNTFSTDSFEKSFTAVTGTTSGRASIITTVDWYERNAIFARDLGFTNNTDLRDVGGINRSSSAGFPGLVFVPSLNTYQTFLAPTTNPTVEDAVAFGTPTPDGGSAGLYNFLEDSDLFPELKYWGFYTRADYEISNTLNAFAELSFRRAESNTQAAPAPMFSFNEQGDAPDGTIQIPAENPFNPWNENLDFDNRVRFVELGNRINDLVADYPRLVTGLSGDIGFTWSWEAAVAYSKGTVTNTNAGSAQDQLVQDAFNGITVGSGPEATTAWLNPFGPTDPRVLDYIGVFNPVTSSFEVRSYDLNFTGDLFDLEAGPVGLAVGAEYREEKIEDVRTALNETGQLIGGSEGSSVFGSRDVFSAYAELAIPVISAVELQVAGRYENYSDFGDTVKPKIALAFRPTDWLLLRASFGQSFLAPNLPFLFSEQSTSFTAQALVDPRRPDDQAAQIRQLGGGNPDLQPEETDTYYIGAVIEPTGRLDGLTLGVEYFQFKSKNLIDRFGAQFLLENEDDPTFGQFVVRNAPAAGEDVGTVQFIRTTWENSAERKYQGWDFNARYDLQTETLGNFRFNAYVTYLQELSFGGETNFSGSRLNPRWRGNFSTAWRRDDWAASLFVTYIGSRAGTDQTNAAGAQVTNDRYQEQIIINPQVSYSGLFDTTVTVGVRNVLDRDPPLDFGEATRYTGGVNFPEPAFWYVRLNRDF